jgi:hypothetical protein
VDVFNLKVIPEGDSFPDSGKHATNGAISNEVAETSKIFMVSEDEQR